MSRELIKMNLIAIVQQLPKDDIEVIQTYISMIEQENQRLKEAIENRGKFIIEQRKEIEDIFIENIEDKAVLGGILNYMDTLNLTIDAQLKTIKSLEEQKKELRSWLENEIIDSKAVSSQYYWFGRVLSKLNELEDGKND